MPEFEEKAAVSKILSVSRPQSYTAMAEFVQKYIGANAGTKLAEHYSSKYGTDDVSYYTEEMVADAFGIILRDGKAMEQFVKDDRSTAQKVLDAVRDLINAVKRALNHQNVELSRDQRTAFMALQNKLTEMESAMVKALESVPQSAEKNTATEGGEVRYALKTYSEHQLDNWATSKSIIVYSGSAQLMSFIDDALSGRNLNKKMYFGAIPADLANRIYAETGIDVEGYNCTLRASEIRKIIAKHGNEKTESLRGQRAITPEDFMMIPEIIQAPETIRLSPNLFEGKPVIEFVKTINGRTTVAAYVSGKHLDLTVQTMYSGKNKRNLAAAAGEQAPANTPEANAGTVPNTSIQIANSDVNPESADKNSLKTTDGDFSEAAKAAIKDAQLAGMMNQGRKDAEKLRRAKETTAEVRRKRDETIQKLKEHQRGREAAMRESRNASAIRTKIQRHVADLSRTLRNPLDKKHVPERAHGEMMA